MTKLLTPDYFTKNTSLFKDNFLHEIPIDIQKAIMGEVKELDKKAAAIMKKLDVVYSGWQRGNKLYSLLSEELFDYEETYPGDNNTHLSLWAFTYNILDRTPDYEDDDTYNSYKKYITEEAGLFYALSIYKKYNKVDFKIDEELKDDEDFNPDYVYEELIFPLVAHTINVLLSDDEWNMMSRYMLYTELNDIREHE